MSINTPVLLLLDGEVPRESLLRKVATNASFIIATDGAAQIARTFSIDLDVIIGDMDSLDVRSLEFFLETKTIIISNPDQYSNDFEKALRYLIAERKTHSLVILGMHGKRTDHTLTNLSVLVRLRDCFESLVVIDDFQEHHLLTATYLSYIPTLPNHSQISLTPLPIAEGVTTHGLFYPITNRRMEFGIDEGLSNIITSHDEALITISGGALLISVAHSSDE